MTIADLPFGALFVTSLHQKKYPWKKGRKSSHRAGHFWCVRLEEDGVTSRYSDELSETIEVKPLQRPWIVGLSEALGSK
jgi:hypothetical protein